MQENKDRKAGMYVYKPQGVCPAEIHFELQDDLLKKVRLVGGGCPGNATLVAKLLENQPITQILPLMEGIICRNGTSCPDQLARAIQLARQGKLKQAEGINVGHDRQVRSKIALVAEINGNVRALKAVLAQAKTEGVEVIYGLGNLTGPRGHNDAILKLASKEKMYNVQGPFDRQLVQEADTDRLREGKPKLKNLDRLLLAPLILSFQLGEQKGIAFYGGFLQELPGFSDFGTYSLEILMVSNLSDYLRDEAVFPALKTMTEKFKAQLVLFAHTGQWRHLRLGEVDFINVGALHGGQAYRYAIIQWKDGQVKVDFKAITAQEQ